MTSQPQIEVPPPIGASQRRPKTLRAWVKAGDNPVAKAIYVVAIGLRRAQIPSIRIIHWPLYRLDRGIRQFVSHLLRAVWYTPLFQARLERPAPGLSVSGGIPLVLGDLKIECGRNVAFHGRNVLGGRSVGGEVPRLKIGDNVAIGYQTIISSGRRIEIGNNVLISVGCGISGYPGHPLDPVARARGEPDRDDQIGDVVIEDDVWLGVGVKILAGAGGVRIGRATVVGAGSIVTRDLPPGVIAVGSPARPVKSLAEAGIEVPQSDVTSR